MSDVLTTSDMQNIYDQDSPPNASLPNPSDTSRYDADILRLVKELQVGIDDTVFRADQSGIWLGANEFADAPFSVDMDGNVIAANLTITGGTITGATIVGGTIETALTGLRIRLNGSTDKLEFMFNSTVYASLYPTSFPGGNGVTLETLSGASGAQMLLQEGASISYAELIINGKGVYVNSGDTIVNGSTTEISTDVLAIPLRTTTQINALTSPPNGCMVYDTTLGVFKGRIAGAWKTFTLT